MENTQCRGCGFSKANIVFEPKYNGFRGRCPLCDGDWPES